MKKTDISGLEQYSNNGPVKTVFYDQGNIKAQVLCLRKGQVIPPCSMEHDVIFYVMKGEGEMEVDGRTERLKPMTSVVVPKQANTRSIRAGADMFILAVQARTGQTRDQAAEG